MKLNLTFVQNNNFKRNMIMKKIFYLGAAMFLMASCGSSETKTTDVAEDTFGMEMPVEAIEMEVPYEGTGNMSDNGDAVSEGAVDKELSSKTEDVVEDAKEKIKEVSEEAKEKINDIKEASKIESYEMSEKVKEASKDAKTKASDAISKSKEKLKQMTEED